MASPDITIHVPSKYLPAGVKSQFTSPSLDFLCRTWSVTHSTLPMWRSAKNVRITYKDLGDDRVDDLVEYEKGSSLKNVKGIDTALGPGSWNWRGKSYLMFATSHWEVLGWGELPTGSDGQVERYLVTWFAKTLFTPEGLDVLTDQKDGLQEGTLKVIMEQLKKLKDAPTVVTNVENNMRPVEIKLPWILKDA